MESTTIHKSKTNEMIKKLGLLCLLWLALCDFKVFAQYKYGTTGLLQMPTADMQEDKTFMFGGGILSPEIIPSKEWWGNYHTFNITLTLHSSLGWKSVIIAF